MAFKYFDEMRPEASEKYGVGMWFKLKPSILNKKYLSFNIYEGALKYSQLIDSYDIKKDSIIQLAIVCASVASLLISLKLLLNGS